LWSFIVVILPVHVGHSRCGGVSSGDFETEFGSFSGAKVSVAPRGHRQALGEQENQGASNAFALEGETRLQFGVCLIL
jgi:hypothetical protein